MEFSTPIIVFATWVVAGFAVARYFASMGHSKAVSYSTGAVMGLVAAALVYFINAPRVPQQRQLADLDPTATEEQTTEEKTEPAAPPPPQEEARSQDAAQPPQEAPADEKDKELTQEMEKAAKEMSFGEEEEAAPAPSPQDTIEKAAEPEPTPVEPPKASPQVAAVPQPQSPPAPATPEPKPAAKPAPPRGPFDLTLTATAKEVWVRVSVDGAPVQTRRLQEGQSFSWKAKRGFVVSADNAGGVRASVNGKTLPRLGREGQSRANIKIP